MVVLVLRVVSFHGGGDKQGTVFFLLSLSVSKKLEEDSVLSTVSLELTLYG